MISPTYINYTRILDILSNPNEIDENEQFLLNNKILAKNVALINKSDILMKWRKIYNIDNGVSASTTEEATSSTSVECALINNILRRSGGNNIASLVIDLFGFPTSMIAGCNPYVD